MLLSYDELHRIALEMRRFHPDEVVRKKSGPYEVVIWKNGSIGFYQNGYKLIHFDAQTHIAHVRWVNQLRESEILPILAGHYGLAGIRGIVSQATKEKWQDIVPIYE
jgi:hypothetical protein